MTVENQYNRIVFKVSGESLRRDGNPLDRQRFEETATSIAEVHSMGVAVVVVLGGGNFWRGAEVADWPISPTGADLIGMYATGMNATTLEKILSNFGYGTQIFSRGPCTGLGLPYGPFGLRDALRQRKIVLLAGGMGVTGISTDVAAVSSAVDASAEAIIMSKFGVKEGVYDRDPNKDPDGANFLPELTASDALDQKLAVMDSVALAMARDGHKPIHVIPASEPWGARYVIEGKQLGSKILPV